MLSLLLAVLLLTTGDAAWSDVQRSAVTQSHFDRAAREYDALANPHGDDLVWRADPRAWHQAIARTVDHRFASFDALDAFAREAKRAGVGLLMLVQIQKTTACPGPWYNGLQ